MNPLPNLRPVVGKLLNWTSGVMTVGECVSVEESEDARHREKCIFFVLAKACGE